VCATYSRETRVAWLGIKRGGEFARFRIVLQYLPAMTPRSSQQPSASAQPVPSSSAANPALVPTTTVMSDLDRLRFGFLLRALFRIFSYLLDFFVNNFSKDVVFCFDKIKNVNLFVSENKRMFQNER